MKDYRTIFHNCLSVQLEDGVYFPVRFTQKLFQFYKDTGVAQFPARAVQTAGITLEFLTSDPDIDFDFFFTCFARELILFLDIITLGFLLPFVTSKKQTFKDILTRTIIIDR